MGGAARIGLGGLAVLALAGCNPIAPPAPVQPPQLSQMLGSQWTPIPVPNSKLVPGAVVQINPLPGAPDKVDIVWLGSLDGSCHVPTNALGVQAGAMPGFSTGTDVSIDASIGAALAHVSLGAAGNVARSSTLTINKASLDSLDLISLDNWLRDPANAPQFQSVCGAILRRPNVFAVEEAFIIEDGTYAIRNGAGAKIAVTPPPGVPVTASAGASGAASGDLRITQPVVFALRRMAPFADGMFAPAAPAAPGATPAPLLSGAAPQQLTIPLAGKLVEGVHLTPP